MIGASAQVLGLMGVGSPIEPAIRARMQPMTSAGGADPAFVAHSIDAIVIREEVCMLHRRIRFTDEGGAEPVYRLETPEGPPPAARASSRRAYRGCPRIDAGIRAPRRVSR